MAVGHTGSSAHRLTSYFDFFFFFSCFPVTDPWVVKTKMELKLLTLIHAINVLNELQINNFPCPLEHN